MPPRNSRSSLLNVVSKIEMRIVDTGKVYAFSVTFDDLTLIQQHSDAHPLKLGQHPDGVMISQHAIDRLFQHSTNPGHAGNCLIVRTKGLPPVVASQNANIVVHFLQHRREPFHCRSANVDVQIAKVENDVAVKWLRQVDRPNVIASDLNLRRIPAAATIESDELEDGRYQKFR